jgi:hypothetical protein
MHRSSSCGFGFLCLFDIYVFCVQIRGDFAELLEGGFEIFDDFPERERRGGFRLLARKYRLALSFYCEKTSDP